MTTPGILTNFYVQQANQTAYLLWDISAGATSYQIQRSTDGVNYTFLASVTNFSYLDSAVTVGVQYWYKVASVIDLTVGIFTTPQSVVIAPDAEMSLKQLRLASQQKADRVNSNFLTLPEWNTFINQSLFELYDLLVATYEDYFIAPVVRFYTVGNQNLYPLPDGTLTFYNQNNQLFVPEPFYKLRGVDLGLNTSGNGYVNIDKFNFIDRNKNIFPNTSSTIYGVYNLQYRILNNQIDFIPAPSANQPIQLWYIPRLKQLLQETDITTVGFSGWLQYVIVRAAKYALDKEESDTTQLTEELAYLKQRIEETAVNIDAGQPDTISDTRRSATWGGDGSYGGRGFNGGY